ncbi:MAG: hypothetical protein E7231_16215 [Cellulosilyticum sp.]|nr:hypothetical protein [Cellulosilyticum sp.]
MAKKEKSAMNDVDITLESAAAVEITVAQAEPEAPAKKTTRKTKSETTKKTTTKTSKSKKEAEVKEIIKEVPVEVVKVITPEVYFQFGGKEIGASNIVEQAQADWIANGHEANAVTSIKIYIKPDEYAAYYVINEIDTGKIEL